MELVKLYVRDTLDSAEVKPFTANTESRQCLNSILDLNGNDTITENQMRKYQEVAARSGDLGVLEQKDFSAMEKQKLALENKYGKYYDISVSADGKFFEVTVKKTPWYIKNPTLRIIKKDFGVRDNVFVNKKDIPYGNEELLRERSVKNPEERVRDWDNTKLKEDDKIRIPVEEISIQKSPKRFWGRLFG